MTNFKIRANKYGAAKMCLDGYIFQSRLEGDYYQYLKMIKAEDLKVHPTVSLVSGIKYKADFSFLEKGRIVFVDTKSDATGGGRFPTVCKLWRDFGPGVLRVVYRGKNGTFITRKEIHSKVGK